MGSPRMSKNIYNRVVEKQDSLVEQAEVGVFLMGFFEDAVRSPPPAAQESLAPVAPAIQFLRGKVSLG